MKEICSSVLYIHILYETNIYIVYFPLFRHYGRVHMQDLESALRYSLWQEVGLHKSIQGDALSALQDYITVLNKVKHRDRHREWKLGLVFKIYQDSLEGG